MGMAHSLLLPTASHAETWNSLPPPPSMQAANQAQQYMLDLQVNGRAQNQIIPVTFREGHYIVRAGDLQRAGIPSAHITSTEMDVSSMPQVKAEYDAQRQRLLLSVPTDWLPEQTFSSDENRRRYPGQVSTGALINYDFYTSRTDSTGTRLSFWNELRLFGSAGQFVSNGVWQNQLEGERSYQGDDYLRYDTYWAGQNEDKAVSWRVGDLITDSLGWNNSVRLGGVQFSRDFSVRPDLITYPLPTFSGQAAVPSTVDLFVNGYKNSSTAVQPGPYSLTNMPFVNGAGNAVVVTTDAVGRQVSTTLPFYVSSSLLKPGLSDYAISAGALRENYGIKSFDYGDAAASGSFRHGVTDWLTLESHAEGAEDLALGGIGAQLRIGPLGVINGAVAESRMMGDSGRQYSMGYQYNNAAFSAGIQHTQRTEEYGDLALYSTRRAASDIANNFTLSRRSTTVNTSMSLNDFGNLGAAWIDITSGAGDKTQLWNLTWSKNLWGNSTLYVSATRDQQQDNWTGAISLIVPFGELSNVSISTERTQEGGNAQRLWASRSMPSDGGLAWDASWANQSQSGDYRQASLRWRNQHIETAGGYYGDDNNATTWAELTGSLVVMDNQWFAANQVNDAFVLVKTGYPDVTVRYENQAMGKTNDKGYLLVPRINAWYPARYDIDTLDLPANMTVSGTEQRFAVKRQSGYLLNFPIEPLRAASVILHDQQGKPLPVSTQVMRPDHATEYVGWDGLVWMEKLATDNPFEALTPEGEHCRGTLHVQDGQPQSLKTYGPITCALTPADSGHTP